jgi:hypothetical protein
MYVQILVFDQHRYTLILDTASLVYVAHYLAFVVFNIR